MHGYISSVVYRFLCFGGFLNSIISAGLKCVQSSENLQGSRNLGSSHSQSVSASLLKPQLENLSPLTFLLAAGFHLAAFSDTVSDFNIPEGICYLEQIELWKLWHSRLELP